MTDPVESRRITRRQWFAATLGAATVAAGIDAIGIEPQRVTVTQHEVGSGEGPTLRIVQLSDLHLRAIGRHAERIAASVHALRPDLLVLTGDAVDHVDYVPLLSTFLALLPDTTHRLAILGNWEHWARLDRQDLRRRYATHGWSLLENASTRVAHGGADLLITGLDDLIGGRPDLARAVANVAPSRNHLLLAHCPTQRDALVSSPSALTEGTTSADESVTQRVVPQLMLSGHTHGGQVAMGRWAPLRPPGSGRYVAGWYRDAPTALYVSRGLGTSVIPARFGAPPEIAVFDWRLAV